LHPRTCMGLHVRRRHVTDPLSRYITALLNAVQVMKSFPLPEETYVRAHARLEGFLRDRVTISLTPHVTPQAPSRPPAAMRARRSKAVTDENGIVIGLVRGALPSFADYPELLQRIQERNGTKDDRKVIAVDILRCMS